MTKKETYQVFTERLEVKDLEMGQYITFKTKYNEHTAKTDHTVKIIGFLDVSNNSDNYGSIDVVVHEVLWSRKREFNLLSSYDSDFYKCGQQYIDVII